MFADDIPRSNVDANLLLNVLGCNRSSFVVTSAQTRKDEAKALRYRIAKADGLMFLVDRSNDDTIAVVVRTITGEMIHSNATLFEAGETTIVDDLSNGEGANGVPFLSGDFVEITK